MIKRVYGIDPGSRHCGIVWGRITHNENDSRFVFVQKRYFTSKENGWMKRSLEIVHNIEMFFDTVPLDHSIIVVEKPMIPKFARTGAALIQGYFMGMMFKELETLGVPIYFIHPLTAKKSFTGMGNANKKRIVKVATEYLPGIEQESSRIKKETIADAFAIAYAGHDCLINRPSQLERIG